MIWLEHKLPKLEQVIANVPTKRKQDELRRSLLDAWRFDLFRILVAMPVDRAALIDVRRSAAREDQELRSAMKALGTRCDEMKEAAAFQRALHRGAQFLLDVYDGKRSAYPRDQGMEMLISIKRALDAATGDDR